MGDIFDEDDSGPLPMTRQIEDWRHNASTTNVTRSGILDQVTMADQDPWALCHVASMLPYTILVGGGDDATRIRFTAFEESTLLSQMAMQLAMEMLNTGDGSVVPELEGLPNRCPVRFTVELLDESSSSSYTVQNTNQVLQRTTTQDNTNPPEACAFFGATRSTNSIPMAILTGLAGRPQISPFSTSSQLDDKTSFPFFARTVTSDAGLVIPLILYLKKNNVNHLGFLHWNDEYGNAFGRSLLEQAAIYHPELVIVQTDIPARGATRQDYEDAVTVLARTQFHWFFCAFGPFVDFEGTMEFALEQGIAGTGEHVWILNSATATRFLASQPPLHKNSTLGRSMLGAGTFSAQSGRPSSNPQQPNAYDKLVQRLQALNTSRDWDVMNEKLPLYPNEPDFVGPKVSETTLQVGDPSVLASALFDATVLLGLATCAAVEQKQQQQSDASSIPAITGDDVFQMMLNNVTFEGASGRVLLDPISGSRQPQTATYRIANVAAEVPWNDTHVKFEVAAETDVFVNGKWTQQVPYVYSDGFTQVPSDVPAPTDVNYNYIGSVLRIVGLTMAGVILAVSVACAIWTISSRKLHVIRASQPIFLLCICLGTFIMGATIIPASFDDEIASQRGCDIACMAAPWTASLGFTLVFSALTSKMYRVNRLFRQSFARRLTLTASDVATPMVVLLTCNVVVLLTWTLLAPLMWEREVTATDSFGQATESQGSCTSSDNDFLPFVIILAVLNFGALAFASHQSYLARGIATSFAESDYIGRAITSMSMVAFVGMPTIILVSDDPRARYFATISIISVICAAILLFIFVPKMVHTRKYGNERLSVKRALSPGFQNASEQFRLSSQAGLSTSIIGQRLSSHDIDSRPESTYSEPEEGMAILNSPDELRLLRSENQRLRKRVVELEKQQVSAKNPETAVSPKTEVNESLRQKESFEEDEGDEEKFEME